MTVCDVCRDPVILPAQAPGADVVVCEVCFLTDKGVDFIETHRTGNVTVGVRVDGEKPPDRTGKPVEVGITFTFKGESQ